jgi:hypothetical protein
MVRYLSATPTSPPRRPRTAPGTRPKNRAQSALLARPISRLLAGRGRDRWLLSSPASTSRVWLVSLENPPPDTTGAIGPTRYIQLVNTQAGIIDRTKTTPGTFIAVGTLNQLAGIAASVNSFDPQVIWDPATNRFYYTMESIFSASDQRLSFGFSTTPSPNNVTTDWCHYTLGFGPLDPDYPKLGDSQFFLIIGVNTFRPRGHFVGSDLIAISKPAAGTACPAFGTFKVGVKLNLVDSGGHQVFTPVPANQIDPSATGFVVAISRPLPSDKLWFFNVTRNSTTGFPLFGPARGVTVRTYAIPPDADQPVFTQKLHTLDARMTQAVQAIDPRFGTFSFWTQHTVFTTLPTRFWPPG